MESLPSPHSQQVHRVHSSVLGSRAREPVQRANNVMLGRYLSDAQRHEIIASRSGSSPPESSVKDGITEMNKKLAAIMPPLLDLEAGRRSAS